MIQIVKDGRAAYAAGISPASVCPYKIPFTPEQLAWSIGWYKAEVDSLSQEIKDLKESDIIVCALLHAQLRGERDYSPVDIATEACPYISKEYTAAYASGWDKGRVHYELTHPHHPV